MINLLVASKIKKITFAISFFIVYTCLGQNSTIENSYGIPNEIWASYYQKAETLIKQADPGSFVNYVIFTNDGKMTDKSFFLKYTNAERKKDKAELIYKIGKGEITTIQQVKTFLASLQPGYIKSFKEFQKNREEIIASQTPYRAPSGGTTPVPFNCGSPCTNPGFESGTGSWDYWTGTACTSSDPCSLVAGFNSTQHQLQTVGGFDPVVGAALPVVPPGGGNNAMMLGDGPVTGGWAARATISFTVSASNANFSYKYAVVLQDPVSGHADPERPYFNVRLRDAGGAVVPCGDYEVLAKPPIVGFTLAPGYTDVYYRSWTSVFVPLSSYIGQCVSIQFTSSDCSQGGHFGYAYIDADCDPLQLASSSPAVCGGSSVTLTAPAGGAAYSWSNTAGGTTGIVGSTTGQTCVVNQGGTYQVVITSVSGPTCTTTLNITVGSNPSNPVASFTNTTVCAGSATNFTDTSTPAGSITAWNWDFDNDGVTDDVTQNPTHTFAAGGTYPVSLTITMGPCNATIIQNVTVNPGTLPVITPAGPFCQNAAAVNLVANPAGGTWSGNGITNAAAGTFTPSPAIVGSNTITYTVTGSGSCPASTTSTVVVNPLPISEAGSPVTICSGAAASIGSANNASYTYSWLPTTGLSAANISNPSITTVNSGTTPIITTYTVTTTANSCSSTDTVTVRVNPQPVLTITNPPAVCSPGTVDITAASVTAGSTGGGVLTYWTNAAATIALAAPNAITTSGTYYIKVTATGGCTDIDPVVVTINPLPASNAGTDVTICSGIAASIGTPTVAGNDYSWSPATGLSAANVSDPSITTTNPGTTPIITTYTITTSVAATGCTTTDDVTVTVNPQPVLTITNPPAVCSPGTVDITAASVTAGSTGGGVLTYWTNAGATIALASQNAVTTSGTYYIKVTATGGCTDIDPVVVTINPLPVSNAGTDVTICSGIAASIGTPTVAGNDYSWSPATGLSASNVSNPSITTTNSGTTPIVTNYTVTTSVIATGCSTTDDVTVTVNPLPVLTITNPAAVCSPNTVDITAAAVTAGSTGGGVLSYWMNAGATSPLTSPNAVTSSGTYYIKVTATGGCTDIDPVTVTVNPLPVSNAGADVTICSGVAASIGTPSLAGNDYSWSPSTGLSAANISNPSIVTTNPGTAPIVTTYTVTTTITATGCTSTDDVTVTVNPQPVLTITNPPAVCSPNTVDITVASVTAGSTGGGLLSYWTDAAGTVALAAPTAVTISGTYYIKVTATGGCTDIDPVIVTINPLPVSNGGSDVTICSGVAASIGTAAVAGNNYSWSPATGLSASNVSNPSNTTTNPGTTPIITTYTVTTTIASTGCTTTDDVTVTVNPQPVLTITDPAATCFPNTIDITTAAVTAGSTGGGILSYWTDAAGTTGLAAPTAVTTSGTYYIKVIATGGCSDIDPVVVTINPLPVSNAGTDVAICTGTPASIGTVSTAGNTYAWLPASGLSAANVSNPSITGTNPGPNPLVTTYTVTTTISATTCSATDSVIVTINPLPVLAITNPPAVCSPNSVDITAAFVTAGSIGTGTLTYWTDAAGTMALTGPSAIAASGTYYIKIVTAAGCSDIKPVTVTIYPLPVSNAGSDIVICTGNFGNIGSPSVSGYTYSWSPSTGLSGAAISNPSVILTNLGFVAATTTYIVTTTANGCSTTDAVDVTVNPLPTANAGSPQYVCAGASVTLNGQVTGGTGIWSGGAGTYNPNNTTMNAVYTPSAAEYAADSVQLTLTTIVTSGPCPNSNSLVKLHFWPKPVANFSVTNPFGCPIVCATFPESSTVGGGDVITDWTWDFGDGEGSTSQNPTHCYPTSGFYNVTLTVTSNHLCKDDTTKVNVVQVFDEPVADFTTDPNPASILNPEVSFTNASSTDVTYWNYDFGDGQSINPNTPNPVHMYPTTGPATYTVTLSVHNSHDCWNTTTHEVVIEPEFTFYIPNAFTPNNDGVNDYFYGQGIGIKEYDIYIFDRWGNMIYHGDNINTSMWDGKANHGSEVAQQDVYVWKVKLTDVFGKKHNYIGTVTLVK
jgi:gliding motility-associated-like protein